MGSLGVIVEWRDENRRARWVWIVKKVNWLVIKVNKITSYIMAAETFLKHQITYKKIY